MKRSAEASPADRFTAVVARYDLSDDQAERLRGFLATLVENPHAPTAVRDPTEAVDVHLADSLAGLPALDGALGRCASERVADIGTGAGLPGIPLAVARPSVRFDLVEATQRKCAFLREVAGQLRLVNVGVRCARAEELPAEGLREAYGVVLARAVAPLATLVEYAGPLLEQGGELVAWKGRRDRDQERAGHGAALQVGLEPVEVQPVTPYEQSRNRHLYVYRKVRPCPARFPRRPGMARRNPLA
ncbi:MAG: 16S rRNA (guanine(527)-N(7))-methyltransferase RsmG [Solirubrobacterales bacterium]